MTTVTVSASCPTRTHTLATEDICALIDWLKVIRADTFPISAKVVNGQAFGDRADKNLVDHPMRIDLASVDPHLPVASGAAVGVPFPASIAEVDLLQHALHGRSIHICVDYLQRTALWRPVSMVLCADT